MRDRYQLDDFEDLITDQMIDIHKDLMAMNALLYVIADSLVNVNETGCNYINDLMNKVQIKINGNSIS